MLDNEYRLSYGQCRERLLERLGEPAPGRIQLLAGPRQVGKTTLLLEIAQKLGKVALYAAADSPEANLPGFWERLWSSAEEVANNQGLAVLLLDEAHLLSSWASRLKGVWDRFRRLKIPIHIVATGSSALHLATGSRESLAGRFERLTLTHWSARSLAEAFRLKPKLAAEFMVRMGTYPGAFPFRKDPVRWSAYVRDSIIEPAIGKDILALTSVRRPALLRQVFGMATSSPAQIVSLQKIQGHLQDAGAMETIAHYLELLRQAFLVAPIEKYAERPTRRRAAPPKLVTLSNALVAALDPAGMANLGSDPSRFGAWVENACLAHAWNSGQKVCYWRQEPFEVDGVLEGSWGKLAVEIKTGRFQPSELAGLLEFVRRNPTFRPLVVCGEEGLSSAERAGVDAMTWQSFLYDGPLGA